MRFEKPEQIESEMHYDDGNDPPSSAVINGEHGKDHRQHNDIGQSLIEMVAELHNHADPDCNYAICPQIQQLRNCVSTDDEFFEKRINAYKRNRQS